MCLKDLASDHKAACEYILCIEKIGKPRLGNFIQRYTSYSASILTGCELLAIFVVYSNSWENTTGALMSWTREGCTT